MSVDLPAPFSPTIAWTVPLSTVSAMSLLATTPGKRLVMPSSRTAGAPWWTAFGGSLGSPPVTGSLLTMTHTPHAGPPRRGRRSSIEAALANLTRDAVPGGELGKMRRPGRRARVARAVRWGGREGRSLRGSGRSGLRDGDLARDDLLLELVELALDVVDVATGRGVVDTAGLQVEDLVARLEGAVLHRGDEVEDTDVDLLDHRGEDDVADVSRGRLGLVGVDADGPLAGRLGRREDTATGTAGCVVDDVGAALVHAVGRGLALVDRVEAREVRRLREVLDVDLDVRLDRLDAGLVALLELLDEVGLDATDEADVVGLGLEGRGSTDEEGDLLLGEGDLVDVGAGRVGRRVVDDGELDLGVGLGGLADGLGVGEADRDDVVVAGVDELLQALLAGGLRLTVDRRCLLDVGTQLGLGLVEARRGGVVERLVTTTTHVVGHADLQRPAGAGRAA